MKQIQLGKLEARFGADAVPYDKKADFKAAPKADCRFCFIGYKSSKTNKDPNQSFAIQLPGNVWSQIEAVETGMDFLVCLAKDYQDTVAHATADGESTVQPDDWKAIITDYFDTTRSRDGVTAKDVRAWLDAEDGFKVAYSVRQLSMPNPKAEAEIVQLSEAYSKMLLAVCGRTCGLGKEYLKFLRQMLETYLSVGVLTKSDETDFLLAQIEKFYNATEPNVRIDTDSI